MATKRELTTEEIQECGSCQYGLILWRLGLALCEVGKCVKGRKWRPRGGQKDLAGAIIRDIERAYDAKNKNKPIRDA